MPRYILHLSDIHIRAGDVIRCRFEEYKAVFDKIIKYISCEFHNNKDDIVCVITGDIFHNRNKIEAPGIKLFWHLITNLSKLCKCVFMIKGNHDFKQESPDEPDLIGSLLHLQNLKQTIDNVVYINNTGICNYDNFVFGTVTIQDVLMMCSSSGMEETHPCFPCPDGDNNIDKHKIALFHGTVKSKEWVKGYDVVLLGDIHIQQVIGGVGTMLSKPEIVNEDITVLQKYHFKKGTQAYAGSTVQQDFGENVLGHGFLLWDMDDKIVSCCHVNNNHGFITIDTNNCVQIKCAENTDWLPLAMVKNSTWFPQSVSVRGSSLEKAEMHCIELGLHVESGSIFNTNKTKKANRTNKEQTNDKMKEGEGEGEGEIDDNDILQTLCTTDKWIQFINDTIDDTEGKTDSLYDGWQKWLTDPTCLKSEGKTKDRLDRISKKLDLYLENQDNQKKKHSNVKITNMKWQWILCFKNNCSFDFSEMDGNINIINGKNGQGKTSFLETICIGLFGEGFPSRTNKNYTASLINNNKPQHSGAFIEIELELNEKERYMIRRAFHTQDDKTKIHAASKESYVKDCLSGLTLAKGKTAIDKWVDANIGNIDSFLISGMLTQSVDRDFFNLSSNMQKQMLDKSLNIASHGYMVDLLKEVKLAIASNICVLKDRLTNYKSIEKSAGNNQDDEITHIENELNILQEKYDNIANMNFQKSNRYSLEEANQILRDNAEIISNFDVNSFDSNTLKQLEISLQQIPKEIDSNRKESTSDIKKDLNQAISDYNIMRGLWGAKVPEPEPEPEQITIDTNGMNYQELEKQMDDMLQNKPVKPIDIDDCSANKGFDQKRFDYLEHKIKSCKQNTSINKFSSASAYSYCYVNIKKFEELERKWGNKDMKVKVKANANRPEIIKQGWSRELYDSIVNKLEYDMNDKPELEEYLSGLKSDIVKHTTYTKDLESTEKLIKGYNEYPFNPNCSECARTPWKLHLTELQNTEKRLLKKLQKIGDINSVKKEARQLEKELELMSELEVMLPAIEYIEYQEYMQWCSMGLQIDINEYVGLLNLKNTIEYEEWNAKYTELKNSAKYIRDNEKFQKYKDNVSEYGSYEDNYNTLASWKSQIQKDLENINAYQCICDAKNSLLTIEIKLIEKQLLNANIRLSTIEKDIEYRKNEELHKHEILRDLEESQEKLKTLEVVIAALSGYQAWIYKDQVLPIICTNVNSVLDVMELDDTLRLNFRFYNDSNNIDWFLGQNPFERASGFQKFICSLGMRIALSKIGASEIRNRQLFLDEGFTACDVENLQKVPYFLNGLLTMYDSIVLVTHLDELKDNVDKSFDVTTAFYAH